jgi:hypothetical protein
MKRPKWASNIILDNGKRVMKHQDLTNGNYDSIAAFCEAVELPCRKKTNHEYWERAMTKGEFGRNWLGAGCQTGRDVLKLMREGWKEGRDRLNELRGKIGTVELVPQDRKRRKIRADMGDSLDIHAVYAGRLETAWTVARRTNTRGPQRIDIVANMICYGGEHADVLFWRGAAAAVLVDILESAGYMVRLVVNFGGNAEGNPTSCRITVKDHGMPFDVTSTSAVILPGFFRALGHAWLVNHAAHERHGMGISVGQGKVEAGEILLSHKVRDHGTAVAAINDVIKRLNDGTLETAA